MRNSRCFLLLCGLAMSFLGVLLGSTLSLTSRELLRPPRQQRRRSPESSKNRRVLPFPEGRRVNDLSRRYAAVLDLFFSVSMVVFVVVAILYVFDRVRTIAVEE